MYTIKKVCFLLLYGLFLWRCQPVTKESGGETVVNAKKTSNYGFDTFDQWLNDRQPLVSAHRGGPYPGFPENALETFQNIADQMFSVIECDVSMTKDSVLILMHDKTLDRTTTGTGKVSDWVYDDLKDLYLIDNAGDTTSFHIPKLDDVLAWGEGRVLFTLDVKRGVPFKRVITAIQQVEAVSFAAVITYRIEDAKEVYEIAPDVMISVSARDEKALKQLIESGIPARQLLGFVGTREPEAAHYAKLEQLGIATILGTLGNLDNRAVAKGDDRIYLTYIKNGANIIATDRPLEVASILGTIR